MPSAESWSDVPKKFPKMLQVQETSSQITPKRRAMKRKLVSPERFALKQDFDKILMKAPSSKLPKVVSENMTSHVKTMEHQHDSTMETAAQKALRILLILENLMKHLEVEDLTMCRFVNSIWLEVSSTELLKRDCFRISLMYRKERKCYLGTAFRSFKSASVTKDWTLSSLNECVQHSLKFPCSHFTFQGGDLASPDALFFFSMFGPRIKHLALWTSSSSSTSKSTFRTTLMYRAPNIQRLEFEGFDYKWEESDRMFLPALKCLAFIPLYKPNETTREILRAASNLEIVENFTPPYTTFLVETNKIRLVKEVNQFGHQFLYRNRIEDHRNFANARPQLRKFGFTWSYGVASLEQQEKMTRAFLKILISSSKSLEELQLCGVPHIDSGKIPRLENLRKLSLVGPFDDYSRVLPLGIHLDSCFPNLHTLALTSRFNWKKLWSTPREIIGCLPSVKILEVDDSFTKKCVKNMHGLCPNFSIFKLPCFHRLKSLMPEICKWWKDLEELELIVDRSTGVFPNLDSAFTGFSQDDCERLMKKSSDELINNFEGLRKVPWLGNITALRSLKIYFTVSRPSVLISKVSGLYAFQLNPHLKVVIGYNHHRDYDMKASLQSVAPFVQICDYRQNRWI